MLLPSPAAIARVQQMLTRPLRMFYVSPHIEHDVLKLLSCNELIRWTVTIFNSVHHLPYALEKIKYEIDVLVIHWHGDNDPNRPSYESLFTEGLRITTEKYPLEDRKDQWKRRIEAEDYVLNERERRKHDPPHDWNGQSLRPRTRTDWYFPRNLAEDWYLKNPPFANAPKPFIVAEVLKEDTRFSWEDPMLAEQSAYGIAVIEDMLRSGFDLVYRYRGSKFLDELAWNIAIGMYNLYDKSDGDPFIPFDPWFDGFLRGSPLELERSVDDPRYAYLRSRETNERAFALRHGTLWEPLWKP